MSEHAAAPTRQTAAEPGSKNELVLQRKCACGQHTVGGGKCAECRKNRLMTQRWSTHRPPPTAMLRAHEPATYPLGGIRQPRGDLSLVRANTPVHRAPLRLQRAPMEEGPDVRDATEPIAESTVETSTPGQRATAPPTGATPAEETASGAAPETSPEIPTSAQASTLIAADDATELAHGQLRKREFLDQLHAAVCVEAEAALAGTGQSSEGCPYLANWFDYYRGQSSTHVEAALRRYAPETRSARTAAEYIPPVAARVRQGVERWARTGEITGAPEGLALSISTGGGLMGAIGGLTSGIGSLLFKAREGGARAADDPAAVQSRLGEGRPLENGVRCRMERAFGRSFSGVRLHTDGTARRLSSEQNARAFTVGRHVAFGAGEYRPGTPVGEALIAHELAHTVQQSGRLVAAQAQSVSGASYDALEDDADQSAGGVVASLWGTAKEKAGQAARNAGPALRSGLSLQRCAGNKPKPAEPAAEPGPTPPRTAAPGETASPAAKEETPTTPAEPAEPKGGWCAKPSDHAGLVALLKKAGAPEPIGTLAYGFTFWSKAKTTKLPRLSIVFSGAAGGKVTGRVEPTTTAFGTMEALYLKKGTYEIPGKTFNVIEPQCGATGKKVPFFSTVSEDMSLLSRRAEQEHCDDYRRAFELSYVQQTANINSLVGTTFGPGSKAQVKAEVNTALEAKGDKGIQGWIDEVNRLATISQTVRDAGRLHRLNPDGDPKKVDDKCTRKDATTVPSSTTKIPGPKTEDIIK